VKKNVPADLSGHSGRGHLVLVCAECRHSTADHALF